jgi:hypothetical protein
MAMRPGRLDFVTFDCDAATRISLQRSNGTCAPSDCLPRSAADVYYDGARIPLEPWSDVFLEKKGASWTEREPEAPLVGLWKVQSPFQSELTGKTFDELRSFATNAASAQRLSDPFCQLTVARFRSDGDLIGHVLVVDRPNLPTTTRDPDRGSKFIGLHLDSWDRLPLGERRKSSHYRISVNVGEASRFLLFFDIDVVEMKNQLMSNAVDVTEAEWRVPGLFLEKFPNYPVLRLKVEPGFAYVAPTDLVVHDGSSLGVMAPTVHLTIRGKFRLPRDGSSRYSISYPIHRAP